jgi:hypothetical protein
MLNAFSDLRKSALAQLRAVCLPGNGHFECNRILQQLRPRTVKPILLTQPTREHGRIQNRHIFLADSEPLSEPPQCWKEPARTREW